MFACLQSHSVFLMYGAVALVCILVTEIKSKNLFGAVYVRSDTGEKVSASALVVAQVTSWRVVARFCHFSHVVSSSLFAVPVLQHAHTGWPVDVDDGDGCCVDGVHNISPEHGGKQRDNQRVVQVARTHHKSRVLEAPQ